MKTCLYILGDPHCGSQSGLMLPGTKLQDPELREYEPKLIKFQEYVANIYLTSLTKCAEFANGAPIAVLLLGDLTQGNKYPDMFVSDRITDQIAIAEQALQPIFSLPNLKAVRLVAGTAAHNFGQAGADVLIASHLRDRHPDIDTDLSYHGLLDVDGCGVDYAHHGPTVGLRTWLHGNNVRYYLRDLMQREINRGNKPPKVVLRGHVHRSCYEYLRLEQYSAHMFVVPSLAGWGNFTHQVTRSLEAMENGILMLMVENGEVAQIKEYYTTLDLRKIEKL